VLQPDDALGHVALPFICGMLPLVGGQSITPFFRARRDLDESAELEVHSVFLGVEIAPPKEPETFEYRDEIYDTPRLTRGRRRIAKFIRVFIDVESNSPAMQT